MRQHIVHPDHDEWSYVEKYAKKPKAVTVIVVICALLAGCIKSVQAQATPDLGGVGQFLASVALSARGGTAVDLNKNVTGVLYEAWPSFHSADGKTEYALLGLGADIGRGASSATHVSPLVLPMASIVGLTSLVTGSNWAREHLTFPNLNVNIDLGFGIKPIPIPGSGGHWVPRNQIEGVATIGLPFGSSLARTAARQALAQP